MITTGPAKRIPLGTTLGLQFSNDLETTAPEGCLIQINRGCTKRLASSPPELACLAFFSSTTRFQILIDYLNSATRRTIPNRRRPHV
jgi:hypothetical protein